jgi:hypothetical protein
MNPGRFLSEKFILIGNSPCGNPWNLPMVAAIAAT